MTYLKGFSLLVLSVWMGAGLWAAPSSPAHATQSRALKPVLTVPFKLSYFFSAESAYDRFELDGNQLKVTFFDDPQHACGQSIQQAPCWTPHTLKTRVVTLTPAQVSALQNLIRSSGFLKLQPVYGHADAHQRYYGYTLAVQLGNQSRKVLYQSFPGSAPMPLAFKQVRDKLFELAGRAR